MPIVVGTAAGIDIDDARGASVIFVVEEKYLNPRSRFGEDAEIGAARDQLGAYRMTASVLHRVRVRPRLQEIIYEGAHASVPGMAARSISRRRTRRWYGRWRIFQSLRYSGRLSETTHPDRRIAPRVVRAPGCRKSGPPGACRNRRRSEGSRAKG